MTTWMTVHDPLVAEREGVSSMAGYPSMLGDGTLLCQYVIEIDGARYSMFHASPLLYGNIALVLDIQPDGEDGVALYH